MASRLSKIGGKSDIFLDGPALLTEAHVGECWDDIRALYQDRELHKRIAASLFNAAITSNMPIFCISKRLLQFTLNKDRNIRFQAISGGSYAFTMKSLYDSKIIEALNVGTKFEEGKRGVRVATLVRIVDPAIRALFKELNAREQEIVQAYNHSNNKGIVISPLTEESI